MTLKEEFSEYVNLLPKRLRTPYEFRKDDPEKSVQPYIGIIPIITVKNPKEKITSKNIYAQYRKNYLTDLTKIFETYFPPLKIMMLAPMQITKFDLNDVKKVGFIVCLVKSV